MADVCADDYQLQVLASMASAGITPYVTCTTVLTNHTMETTERYSLPDNIGTVLNNQCVSLEPVFSRGIYRPIPAGSRVTEIIATAVTLGSSIPYPADKTVALSPIFKSNPYVPTSEPTDITVFSAHIGDGNVVTVAPVSFSLIKGAPLALEGTTVSTSSKIHEYIPIYQNNTKAPCYLPVDSYPALLFTSTAGALPRDLVLQIDITYESPRTAEAFDTPS